MILETNFNHITDELLVKYLLEEASPEERQQVIAWMSDQKENQQYFDQFKTIWDAAQSLAITAEVNEEKAWQRLQYRMSTGDFAENTNETNDSDSSPSVKFDKSVKSVSSVKFVLPRVAASIILLAAISFIGFLLVNKNQVQQLALNSGNEVKIDTLSDGSIITLNKASSLSYPSKFKGDKRAVALKGEAFFNITPDKEKPFIISVDSIEVTVVGTSFNIKAEKESTEIIVETGIVRVATSGQSVELRAGERIVFNAGGAIAKEKISDKLYNYYRSKEFVCDNTPLWKLVDVIKQAPQSHFDLPDHNTKLHW
ncbi:MAG: hypothetical protein B7Z54_06920 [Sphingobacteriales bacterium 12-47-4]|nr:MAG: hypothetical protein B7Z54_06920 [Sphingobacteriales bacterium 12-47-4]